MPRRLKTHQKLLVAAVTLLTAMLLLAVGVYAYDQSQQDQIAPGVRVGGVEIGGRSVEEARGVIEREVVAPLQKPVVVAYEGERFKLSPKQLQRNADIDAALQEAVDRTRQGGLIERVGRYVQGSAVNANIDPRISFSQKAVEKFVARIASKVNRDPQNASITPSGDQLKPTPGKIGITLREDELRDAVLADLEGPAGGEPIAAQVDRVKPEITTKRLAQEYPLYVTISRSEFKLRFFRNLKLAKTYTIAVGAIGYDTPAGEYTIQNKEINPTWHVPDSDWTGDLAGQSIPPGPGNPLKARWMGIYDGAGIHGTDDIGSLGTAASHGCIRMAIPEVIELFEKVEVGTPVYIQ